MLRYILRRLLLLIPLLLAASAIIFLLLRLGAGDPALDYLRLSNLPPTEEMVASTRELLGLNQPLAMQYLHWLWRALHLDFGLSYATQRPVLDDLLHFLPATLLLTGAALALILVTSLPLGIWAARHRDRLPDYIVRLIAFLGVSMPNFWLAFLLVMLFSVHLQWLPAMGYGDWQHLILPAVSIAFMSLAINARLLRASMLDAASQRHVIWARVAGMRA
ncbi:ABC transporter permease subunit, partial [Klebsiella pneumoniae]